MSAGDLRRPDRLGFVGLLLAALGACSAISFGSGEGAPDASGTWDGTLEVEGEALPVLVIVRQDGDDLDVVLTSDAVDLEARGSGEVAAGGGVTMSLRYAVQCPGEARLDGRIEDSVISGRLTAADCTGSTSGDFTFRRR